MRWARLELDQNESEKKRQSLTSVCSWPLKCSRYQETVSSIAPSIAYRGCQPRSWRALLESRYCSRISALATFWITGFRSVLPIHPIGIDVMIEINMERIRQTWPRNLGNPLFFR